MAKEIIVSGIQPTGNLHVGNYLGAVKNWVELQNSGKYEMYIFIADLHALTGKMKPEELRAQVNVTCAELLAAGVDPKKTTFFIQSHIPEHAELAWIFNCLTPVGMLVRMTQFKDKTKITVQKLAVQKVVLNEFVKDFGRKPLNEAENAAVETKTNLLSTTGETVAPFLFASTGLLTYPVLQAADILLYHGNLVPVGQDQIQHVELTRDAGRWFNNKYGEYFPETKHLLTNFPKIMSLMEPTKKMSKSLGQDHVIELADEPTQIEAKLKKAVTATAGGGEAPGVTNLLALLKEFGDEPTYKKFLAAEKDKSIRYGDLKQTLASAIADYFVSFRTERAKLLKNEKVLAKIMAEGAVKAQKQATKTIAEVRKIVGLR